MTNKDIETVNKLATVRDRLIARKPEATRADHITRAMVVVDCVNRALSVLDYRTAIAKIEELIELTK